MTKSNTTANASPKASTSKPRQGATTPPSESEQGHAGTQSQQSQSDASIKAAIQATEAERAALIVALGPISYAIQRPRFIEGQDRWVRNASTSPLSVGYDSEGGIGVGSGAITITRPLAPNEDGSSKTPAPPLPEKHRTPVDMQGSGYPTKGEGSVFMLELSALGIPSEAHSEVGPRLVSFIVALLDGASQKAKDSAQAEAEAKASAEAEKRKALGSVGSSLRRAFQAMGKGPGSPRALEGLALFAPSPLAPSDPPPALTMIREGQEIGFTPDAALIVTGKKALEAMKETPLVGAITEAIELLEAIEQPTEQTESTPSSEPAVVGA